MKPEPLMVYLKRWAAITVSNHTILGIFFRDPKYCKKCKETGEEEYTTVERIIVAVFYVCTIMSFNLTANLIIHTVDSTCNTSNLCMSSCKASNQLCNANVGSIGPFTVKQTYTKLTKNSKAPTFAVKLPSNQLFNYSSTPESSYFSFCAASYNCIPSCVEKDLGDDRPLCSSVPESNRKDLWCLTPSNTCKLKADKPKDLSLKSKKVVLNYLKVRLILSAISSLLISILITPSRIALKFVFEGFCRPSRSNRVAFKLYTIISNVIIIGATLVAVAWLAIALYALFGYFSLLQKAVRNSIIITTAIFFVISVSTFDMLITAATACIGRKIFCPASDYEVPATPAPVEELKPQ